MTYNAIIDRVLTNIGREKSATFLETVKKDIFDIITKIYRKTEPIRQENSTTITITTASQEVAVPSDFFVPLEVLFYDSDGLHFPCKELEYEEYLRWNPDTQQITTSFNELVTSATPISQAYTQENFDLDGLIGYTFSNALAQKLLWKPAVNGTIKLFYSALPSAITALTGEAQLNVAFHELIVLGVTIKQLVRRLKDTSDQMKLIGLQTEIKYYQTEWNETLSNFNGFVNRNTSTPVITPFDFLNDSSMLLQDGR